MSVFSTLLEDPDPEIRVQALQSAGEVAPLLDSRGLLKVLRDSDSRVRFHATIAFSSDGWFPEDDKPKVIAAVRETLRENGDRDLYLRHAGVLVLSGMKPAFLVRAAQDDSAAYRLAACLALRRKGSAEVAIFLNDRDARIALEAAPPSTTNTSTKPYRFWRSFSRSPINPSSSPGVPSTRISSSASPRMQPPSPRSPRTPAPRRRCVSKR